MLLWWVTNKLMLQRLLAACVISHIFKGRLITHVPKTENSMGLSVVPIGCKPTAEADNNKTFKSRIHSVKRVRCGSSLCTCAREISDVNYHQPTLLLVSALPK